MQAQREHRRGDLIPVIVAAIVAVVSQTSILFNDFGPGNDRQSSSSARMITAAVVSRAGAIPSEPATAEIRYLAQRSRARGEDGYRHVA